MEGRIAVAVAGMERPLVVLSNKTVRNWKLEYWDKNGVAHEGRNAGSGRSWVELTFWVCKLN